MLWSGKRWSCGGGRQVCRSFTMLRGAVWATKGLLCNKVVGQQGAGKARNLPRGKSNTAAMCRGALLVAAQESLQASDLHRRGWQGWRV